MAHFLIIGGAGYIGSVLVPRLLAELNMVTVIDCFYFGRSTLPNHPRLQCIKQDSRDILETQFEGIDIVIDLAAMSNDPCGETFQELTWSVNHKARVRTAQMAKQAGVKRYILPSSCSVYGFQEGLVSETSPTTPLTTYAQANLKAEEDVLKLSSAQFCTTALRLSTVFGYSPRMRLDLVVNAMACSAWKHGEIIVHGSGTQHRPLLHVKDVASALIHTSKSSVTKASGEIYNIGGQHLNCQIKDIAEKIQDHLSIKGKIVRIIHNGPQDLRSYCVDFRKAKNILGWKPKLGIDNEIEKLIEKLNNCDFSIDERCYTLDWYNKILGQDLRHRKEKVRSDII